MPEWPDLAVARARLERALVGRRIDGVRVGDPVVVRSTAPLDEMLVGRTFRSVAHRGRFLLFELDGTRLIVNPMLSGIFELRKTGARAPKAMRVAVALDDGVELRYLDDTKMGKVYVLDAATADETVPGLAEQGPHAPEIAEDEYVARARRRGGDVRGLLQDARVASGIGNAYADEILWEARLHPKRSVRDLGPAGLAELHAAIRRVLARAFDEVEAGMPSELGVKVRSHMRVRGRAGQPCPRCRHPLRRMRKGDDETDYCSVCQPPPAGQLL